MQTYQGIVAFPGLAIGQAVLIDTDNVMIPRQRVAPQGVDEEVRRLDEAIKQLSDEISDNKLAAHDRFGSEVSMIFEAHLSMLRDAKLHQALHDLIRRERFSAELAVHRILHEYISFFRGLQNERFSDRATDFVDLERRLLSVLSIGKTDEISGLPEESIILARDLTPSQTATLDRTRVLGFVTAAGGRTSHTAILAGAMEIPAIVGMGDFLPSVSNGQRVILDANEGLLIVDPDDETIARYKSKQGRRRQAESKLSELRDQPAVMLDGCPIEILANIEFPNEAAHCLEMGAMGVGLYRTEFLYLDRKSEPTEEDHFNAYRQVLQTMGDKPVVVRTLDLGADKVMGRALPILENNPVLGLRSIRLSLREIGLFKCQLRALLRASVYGNLRIMFPLISTMMELRRCKQVLADVREDLEEEGIEFKRDIPLGMMVEVPSAALMAQQFARLVDFFSIGTNDLIQYTLAADRTNGNLASLYSASDPAVLKLVRGVIQAAQKEGIKVGLCGEMCAETMYIPLLIGLGLRSISVTPHMIPQIKQVIRSLSPKIAQQIAGRVQRMDNARDITNLLRDRIRRIVPELSHDSSS